MVERRARRWQHLVATYDAALRTMLLYVDSQPVFDNNYAGPDYSLDREQVTYTPNPDHAGHVVVGHDGWGRHVEAIPPCFMNGATDGASDCPEYEVLVDKLALYPSALPADRVRKHYFAVHDVTVGLSQCTACPGGSECPEEGMDQPRICPAGLFRSMADTTSLRCRNCTDGTYSVYVGRRHEIECLLCPPGLVCTEQGMSSVNFSQPCTLNSEVSAACFAPCRVAAVRRAALPLSAVLLSGCSPVCARALTTGRVPGAAVSRWPRVRLGHAALHHAGRALSRRPLLPARHAPRRLLPHPRRLGARAGHSARVGAHARSGV